METLSYSRHGHPITWFPLNETIATWERKQKKKGYTRKDYEKRLEKENKQPKKGRYLTENY